MNSKNLTLLRRQGSIVILLLLQFVVRTVHPALQEPYLDEGFHIRRAAAAWDFAENPGRFSHGKVLLYYWLGLFEAAPKQALVTSRLGMALFALLTGAAIYLLARLLANHRVGLVALGWYAILPLAVFYERMAMADSLASGLACLIAWRSLVLARHPHWRQGVILGVLLALVTLAKLTMLLLPALPVLAITLYAPWRKLARAYALPLIVAAGVMALIWLPLLVPAYFARHTDHPFVLVDSYNLRESDPHPATIPDYVERVWPLMGDFVSQGLLIAAGVAVVIVLAAGIWDRVRLRHGLFLVGWAGLIALLPLAGARLVTARYTMPLTAPLVIVLALAAQRLWILPRIRFLARPAILIGAGAWLCLFAIPFIHTDLTAPADLPLHGTNYTEYQSGFLSANETTRKAAATLNALDPVPKHIYANWNLCHLLYFYTDHAVECLSLDGILNDLRAHMKADLAPGESAYLALSGYKSFYQATPGLCWEEIVSYPQPHIKSDAWSVRIVRLWNPPCA